MLGQSILPLGRVRVLLVGNDHVLDQVNHEQIAAVIRVARVAEVNPAAGAAPGLLTSSTPSRPALSLH
jgi:hypothetical protein